MTSSQQTLESSALESSARSAYLVLPPVWVLTPVQVLLPVEMLPPSLGAAPRFGCCPPVQVLPTGSGAAPSSGAAPWFGCCPLVRVLSSVSPPPRFISVLVKDSQQGWKQMTAEGAAKQNLLEQNTSIMAQSQGSYCRISPALPRSEQSPFGSICWLCWCRAELAPSLCSPDEPVPRVLCQVGVQTPAAGARCATAEPSAQHWWQRPPSQVAGRWMLLSSLLQ